MYLYESDIQYLMEHCNELETRITARNNTNEEICPWYNGEKHRLTNISSRKNAICRACKGIDRLCNQVEHAIRET